MYKCLECEGIYSQNEWNKTSKHKFGGFLGQEIQNAEQNTFACPGCYQTLRLPSQIVKIVDEFMTGDEVEVTINLLGEKRKCNGRIVSQQRGLFAIEVIVNGRITKTHKYEEDISAIKEGQYV